MDFYFSARLIIKIKEGAHLRQQSSIFPKCECSIKICFEVFNVHIPRDCVMYMFVLLCSHTIDKEFSANAIKFSFASDGIVNNQDA